MTLTITKATPEEFQKLKDDHKDDPRFKEIFAAQFALTVPNTYWKSYTYDKWSNTLYVEEKFW